MSLIFLVRVENATKLINSSWVDEKKNKKKKSGSGFEERAWKTTRIIERNIKPWSFDDRDTVRGWQEVNCQLWLHTVPIEVNENSRVVLFVC